MQDTEYMQEALKEAAKGRDEGNWAIGCVVVYNGEIIVRGHNKVHTAKNRTLHAEMDAIQQLQEHYFDYNGKDLTIYTTFEPCIMCFGAIVMSGIRTIVAGVDFDGSGALHYFDHIPPFFQQEKFRTTYTTGVLAQDCAKMWASGAIAKQYIENGTVNLDDINKLNNDKVRTFVSPTITPAY